MSLSHISESIPNVVSKTVSKKAFKPKDAAFMCAADVEALSQIEQMAWLEAKKAHQEQQRQSQKEAKFAQKTFKCRFCLDKSFVFVLPIWVEFGMPKELTFEQIELVQHSRTCNIAMPCECHPSRQNAFFNTFGEPLLGSLYGRWLVHYRKEIAKQRSQEGIRA